MGYNHYMIIDNYGMFCCFAVILSPNPAVEQLICASRNCCGLLVK